MRALCLIALLLVLGTAPLAAEERSDPVAIRSAYRKVAVELVIAREIRRQSADATPAAKKAEERLK